MIPDRPWTTPPDASRPDSYHIHLSFSVLFGQLSVLSSCQPGPLSVSRLPFTLPPSPSLPAPAGSELTLKKAAVTNMDGHVFSALKLFLIPHWLLTFFNWSKQLMCNQLPSGSISTASQILGLLVSSETSLARQPSRASVMPNRCQEWEFLRHGALHTSFIQISFRVLSFLTNILDTLRQGKGTFVRCHGALCQLRDYIAKVSWGVFLIVKMEEQENL